MMLNKKGMVMAMILEFSCSNYKSIKDKVTYSALAGKDNTFEDEIKKYGKYRVLRSSVIYGANGSGKSNFISAISFMKLLVINSINHQPGQGVFQASHKLNSNEIPSTFDIQFVKNDIRYAYGFSVKNNTVFEEYLYYFPNGRQTKIFERENLDIIAGDKYKKDFDISKTVLKDNRLLLSCAANYSDVVEIEQAFLFFSKDLVVYHPEENDWTEKSIDLMQKSEEIKKVFLAVLDVLGTGIKDVKVRLEKMNTDKLTFPPNMPDAIKSLVLSAPELNQIEAKVVYDGFETDLMTEESTGIRRLFEIVCPIIDIINNGKILICDEIENGLHEEVVKQIIQLFKYALKDEFAQLIFSTHDTSLLSADLFRRDQIWFTELNSERATDLYSLAEIRNVRKTENIEKGYISGKYGAIPMLSENIYDVVKTNN